MAASPLEPADVLGKLEDSSPCAQGCVQEGVTSWKNTDLASGDSGMSTFIVSEILASWFRHDSPTSGGNKTTLAGVMVKVKPSKQLKLMQSVASACPCQWTHPLPFGCAWVAPACRPRTQMRPPAEGFCWSWDGCDVFRWPGGMLQARKN